MTATHMALTPQTAQENYDRLSPIAQAILQFLSILMEPINRSNLAKHLRDAGILGTDGRALSIMGLTPIIDRLAGFKLIVTGELPANQFYCAASIAAHATRRAVAAGQLQRMAAVIQREFPLYYNYAKKVTSYERCLRDLRIAVFSHDPQQAAKYAQVCLEQCRDKMMVYRPFVQICDHPFVAEWFRALPPSLQADALSEIVASRLENFATVADILPLLHELRHHPDESLAMRMRKQLVTILIFQGHVDEAQGILQADKPVENAIALQGWIHFLRGENEQAVQSFDRLMGVLKKVNDRRRAILRELSGLFLLLALMKSGQSEHRTWLVEFLVQAAKKPLTSLTPICACLEAALAVRENKIDQALTLLKTGVDWIPDWINPEEIRLRRATRETRLTKLFRAVAGFWADIEQARKDKHELQDLFDQAERHGHHWALMESATLMAALDPTVIVVANLATGAQRKFGTLLQTARGLPW
ncbi:MAG: hypothetical protein HQL87_18895 [Magnetococcales bacterium]|nr:hypothetical protein [Magnetococcales bacterium]